MTTATIKARIDSFTNEVHPNRNFGDHAKLRLDNSAGAVKRAYLHFTLPDAVMRGATVQSATLKFYPSTDEGATAGEVRRLTEAWKEGQLTHNNAPTTTATNAVAFNETWAGEIELDVIDLILDAVSAGTFHGFRITTTTNAVRRLYSSEAANDLRPTLVIEWNKAPLPPDDLTPSGGRAVGVSTPTLGWQFQSVFGEQAQSAYRVVIRDATTLLTFHDSFDTVSTNPFHVVPSMLTVDTLYEWRVRARDGSGLWSDYSDWAQFQYAVIGTVTIDNPGVSGIVNDTTPPFIWTHAAQAEAEVSVFQKDSAGVYRVIHELTRRVYASNTYTPPQGVIRSQEAGKYKVRVRVWPEEEFEQISGTPNYAEAERIFTFTPTEGVDPPTDFLAVPDATIPNVALTWSRDPAPDEFLLLVDGEVVVEMDPADVFESGTSYAATYWGAIPGTNHTYALAAVVDDEVSAANPTDTATVDVSGIWLVDVDAGDYVRIRGTEEQPGVIGESGESVYPIGRRSPVRIRDSVRGIEDTVSGIVIDEAFLTADQAEALLRELNEALGRYRYIAAPTRNFPVHIFNLSTRPISGTTARGVSFAFEQVGGF